MKGNTILTVGTKNQVDRNSWVIKILKGLPKGSKILDAGAGSKRYKAFCSHLKYTSQDFGQSKEDSFNNPEGSKDANWKNSSVDIISDILDIPVKDRSYDVILCTEVLEHLPYPDKAITEFARILKPNGKLILTAPFSSMTHQAPFYFINGYSKYWYQKVLKDANFKRIKIENNGNYFEFLAQLWRRIGYVRYRYTKPRTPTNYLAALLLKIITPIDLFVLGILSALDQGSQELLCLGYFVTAVKK